MLLNRQLAFAPAGPMAGKPAAEIATSRSDYRPEIDGLRAIAVLAVILFHAGIPGFSGGYVGVDIFFVISGYLITSIIWKEAQAGRFSYVGFYERRVRRIIPALLTVIAVSLPLAWTLMTPGQLKNFGQSIVATLGFAANLYLYVKNGYFAADSGTLPLMHMWSLAVEEQFYILFPAILLLCRSMGPGRLSLLLGVLCIASLAYSVHLADTDPRANFFWSLPRAWELGVGSLLALQRPDPGSVKQRVTVPLELAGMIGILAPILLYGDDLHFPGLWALPPVLGSALIIGFSTPTSPLGRLLASPPFVGIGLISYSAYLWHHPLFAFARIELGGPLPMGWTGGLIAATLLLAWASWAFVERPFRNRATVSRAGLILWLAPAALLLGALGLAAHVAKGFPGRFDAETQALAATAEPSPYRDICHTDGVNFRRPEKACRYGGARTTWAVLGDSQGIEPAYALAEDLKPLGQGLVHLTFSGCQAALTFETSNIGCSEWMRQSVAWLERQPRIEDVLLVFRSSFYLYGDQTKFYPAIPSDRPNFLEEDKAADARSQYWLSFRAIVDRLIRSGKRVHIVAPVPELPVHVERYIYGRHHAAGEAITGVPLAWYRSRERDALREISRLRGLPGVTILDPTPSLCEPQTCYAVREGKALYFDDNHLSLTGARRFVADQRSRGALP